MLGARDQLPAQKRFEKRFRTPECIAIVSCHPRLGIVNRTQNVCASMRLQRISLGETPPRSSR